MLVATAEPIEFPRELGRYTLLGELASGGMADVYIARQSGAAGFERIVAIKCCHEHLRRNRAFAEMFLDEARLAAHIRHHNVVATLDVSDGDPLYLVMEYVEGCSLSVLARSARRACQRIPLDVVLRVACDALAGLHAAHESCGPDGEPLGLVHCDVSPQNILVGVDGSARITDFGIARATASMVLEDQSIIKGKPSYMAPEQIGSDSITRRVDVFSAGVVLWELLTGKRLFRSSDDGATMNAVLTRTVPAPSSVEPSVPPALDAVVLRALERDPAERFPSAGDFLGALECLPLAVATARCVGEYVRREAGPSLSPGRFPSGKYPRAVAEAQRLHEPSGEASSDDPGSEVPTRVCEPPQALVIASTREPEAPVPEAYRARRMIVAIALVLVGCAVGLLFARQPAQPSTPSTAPVPVDPPGP
jgi:serine/threonine protein kinase